MYTLGEAVGYIRLEMGKFLSDAERAKNSTKDIESEFDKLGGTVKSVESIIVKSFAAIGAAVASGLGAAVNVGSQFEASMSQVAATMGMTADDVANGSADFEKLSAAAKEMGETTKFSASQAADALNYLALAGYDTEQAISTLPTVLNLAASGGMDLARASDMITDAASALGLSIDDMSLFADKMAKAAQSSNTSVEQLGNAILQIGGTAKNLAGGVTELNTALGILANNGIKSAEGGTALRQIILNLTAPTEKAAAYMEELGLKVADAAGNVRPLNEIFRDLDEILQSRGITGSADKIKALSQIFDARQLKSANALLSNYGESWDRLYEKIDNAEGAASQMAETMETNLRGALTILGSTAEGFGITVYESIESSFKKAVEEATRQLSDLNNAFKSSEMQESLKKISDAISEAIVKLSEFLSEVIPKLVSGLSDLIDNFDKISAIVAGLATSIGLAAGGMTLFKIQTDLVTQSLIAQKLATLAANAALLANPYTLVAVAIGVLVGALVAEYNQQQENIRQLDEMNEKYYEAEDAVNKMADNYDKQIEKANELNTANDEQINHINELVNLIQKNTDETGKMTGNYELVKDAIDELNSIIPVNLQYQGDQILNYGELTQASKDYCEQLKNEAILESKTEQYKVASTVYDEAISKRQELMQSFLDAQEAYRKYSEIKKAFDEGYFVLDEGIQAEAEAAGMAYSDYVEAMAVTTERALNSTQDAYLENKKIIRESSETLKQAKIDITKTQNEIYADQLKTGQEVTGIFKTESEARIGIAEIEAERLAEINRQSAQERTEIAEESAEEVISAEEELEAALEELEIAYNTGVIASDEEYHRRRLELLENFHGEWSKKSSGWLKSELDWEQKQKDDAIKEEKNRLDEQERLAEEERRKAKQRADEAKRDREQKKRQAEQDARDAERQLREETNLRIEELDRRKKREADYTDEQYVADLIALRDTLEKESDLWWQLDDKIFDYQQKITENNKKELDNQLKDQFQAIQDRKDLEENYSNEQYLQDLIAFQKTLDEESDLYKQVGKEITKVNKDIKDDAQKTADTAFKDWQKGFNSLKSEAESAYEEIQDKQKKLEESLNSQIKLYDTQTKKVKNLTTGLWEDVEVKKTGTAFLKDQLKDLEDYQKQLEKLEQRGISEGLMQEIMGMSEEDRKEYIKQLNSMSDSSLKAYDEAYNNLKEKNKEFSEKYYADEVEAFKTEWGKKIEDYIKSLPKEAREAAKELIGEFIKGISDTDNEQFNEIFSGFTDEFVERSDKGLLFKNYGTDSVKNLVVEISKNAPTLFETCEKLAQSAAQKFSDTFAEFFKNADLFDSIFNMNVPSTILNASVNPNLNNPNLVPEKYHAPEITKDDVKDAIKEAMPDGDVILNVDGDSFARVSRKQLNILSQKSGNLALNV